VTRVSGLWPLTGRVEELRLIKEYFVERGRSAGVAIIGPAGVGKSRLVLEAVTAVAAAGSVVRWTVATESARAIPLGVFSEWTAGLQGNALQLVSGVIDALTTTPDGRHVVLAVEDAHLLDELSAFVVHQLVLRRSASVIVSIRSGEPVSDAVTALWKDRHVLLLELQPLSRDDCDLLLGRALDGSVDAECAQRMWALTRGNVLYLRHLVDQERSAGRLMNRDGHWVWTGTPLVSPTLTGLIESQVGSVPEEVLEVVDIVAVAEPVETSVLGGLVDSSVIEDAEHRGLISITAGSDGAVVRIGHPLYGEVRRKQAGPWRLSRLRGKLARVLAADVGDGDVDGVVRLGVLWLESDLPPDPQLFLRAAQAALMRLDLGLVERFAHASIRAGGGPDPAILLAHVFSFSYLSRAQENEELLASLDIDVLDDAQLSNMMMVRASNLLWPLGRPQESWDLIETALRESNPAVRPSLQAFRAVQLAFAARPSDAIAIARQLDRRRLPDLPAVGGAAWGLVLGLGDVGRISEANAVAAEGYERAYRSRDAAYLGVALSPLHVAALLFAGCIPDAVAAADHSYRQCADVPGFTQALTAALVGTAALGRGSLDLARRQLASAMDVFSLIGDSSALCYHFTIVFVEIVAKLGDVDGAAQALSDMQRREHPSSRYVEADRLLATAWVAAARGAITEAHATARIAADYARTHGQLAREVMCLQTAAHFGDKTAAARLTELADLVEGPRAPAAAAFAAALAAGDGVRLQDASEQFEALGDMFAAADVSAHTAIAYRRQDRRGTALMAAGRAQRLAAACGGAVSPALREAAGPLPFTGRQREILRLATNGLSNREIAQRLVVSVRTVEGHLYRASQRVGVSSRDDLIAILDGKI
jgi:DNA-binding CsgD family transcriptional regulator